MPNITRVVEGVGREVWHRNLYDRARVSQGASGAICDPPGESGQWAAVWLLNSSLQPAPVATWIFMKYLAYSAVLWGLLVTAAGAADDYPAIRKALAAVLPNAQPDQIKPTPLPGLYEVSFGAQLFYISEDGRHLVQGHIMDLATRTDLTEERQGVLRQEAVAKLGDENMIVFPASKPKHTVTVFTDIDCGYCRKLHEEMKAINELGITVRYMFFPRSGPDTPSYHNAVSVWCAKDRRQALTDAKAGKSVPNKSCENPIKQHMALVEQFGLRGTPAILLEDGSLVPGYVPAKQLQAMVEGKIPPQP